jgi:hypothetical protein
MQWRRDPMRAALLFLALVYALFAGLRLVSETDLGWQMATGRHILEQYHIPSTALFTYRAPKAPWIYPAGSEVFFYLCFLAAGGFAAISWLGALACGASVALANWRGGRATRFPVPPGWTAPPYRTMPRADIFTTVLFDRTACRTGRLLARARGAVKLSNELRRRLFSSGA